MSEQKHLAAPDTSLIRSAGAVANHKFVGDCQNLHEQHLSKRISERLTAPALALVRKYAAVADNETAYSGRRSIENISRP